MKKILVIEDSPTIRENIAEFLELKQYNVATAADGKEALDRIKTDNVDLVICDVKMPHMGGFELKTYLNRDEALRHIPFVFLTAAAQRTDIEKGNELGAAAYVTKPFDMEDLIKWVDELL